MKEENIVTSVASFLEVVHEIINQYKDEIIVYRGEDQIYDLPCLPNIFRKKSMTNFEFFEKNLFDSMRQNNLSGKSNYLENAIDAQHGEFPSRLLDVSYNCLVALYFAVTPYYHFDETEHDDKDGRVFIFHFDKVYSPGSEYFQECYESIITRKYPILSNNMIFGKNHKLVDHCKLNNRIVAQQGAFVLFQGDDAEALPAYVFQGFRIPKKSKKQIRKDLKILFGIHTGYIYPEIVNLVNELSEKSKMVCSSLYTFKQELKDIGQQLEQEIEYYYKKLQISSDDNVVEISRMTEKVLYSYYLGIMQLGNFVKNNDSNDANKNQIEFEKFVAKYNNLIYEFQNNIDELEIDEIEPNKFEIRIDKG